MESLLGRRVQVVYGALYPIVEGVVVKDYAEQVMVYIAEEERTTCYAKYRLLSSEYAECAVPSAVGVYLLTKPFVGVA